MKKYICILLLFSGQLLHAQYYIVYQLNGNVKHKNKKMTVGQQLTEKDSIIISDKASVTLLCPDYIPVTLVKKGVSYLKNTSCKASDFSVSIKYWKSVYTQLLHPHEPITEKNRKEYMQNVGGVTRGDEDENIYPPHMKKIYAYKEQVTLKWQIPEEDAKEMFEKKMKPSFHLLIYSDPYGNSIIIDTLVNDNFFDAMFLKNQLEDDKIYYWAVKINDKKYEPLNQLKFLSNMEYVMLWKRIKEETIQIHDAAEQNFAIGTILESNYLYGEAFIYFNKASIARPKNIEYIKAVNGLK